MEPQAVCQQIGVCTQDNKNVDKNSKTEKETLKKNSTFYQKQLTFLVNMFAYRTLPGLKNGHIMNKM